MTDSNEVILNEIGESNALIVEKRLEILEKNLYILTGNYRSLKQTIVHFDDPENHLKFIDNRFASEQFASILEVIRKLHNFVASVKSTVELNRNYMRIYYEGQQVIVDYQEVINQKFVGNMTASFVEDLRNFFLHVSRPAVFSSISLQLDDARESPRKLKSSQHVFTLKKMELLESSFEWNPLSIEFLEKQPDDISIMEVCESYFNLIDELYKWLFEELRNIHREDLEWLANKRDELDLGQFPFN